MVTQINEKGKIFTQIVSKQPVKVMIQTANQLIHGLIHVRPDARLKDELSGQDKFLAVTDAIIFNLQNEEMLRCHFIMINIDYIFWVTPEEELIP